MATQPESGLKLQHEKFCYEYLVDFNQGEAYKRAGYSPKNDTVASTNAGNLLKKPEIQAFLRSLMNRQQQRLELTSDRIIEEYAAIATSDITDVVNFDSEKVELKDSKSLPKRVTRAIKQISIQSMTIPNPRKGEDPIEKTICTVTMHDKLKALEKMGDRFGAFDRPEDNKSMATGIELELVVKKPEKDADSDEVPS